jgi:hypothetical protein
METGAKKIVKTQKTKFRKNQEVKENNHGKPKHHDKTFYRLAKEEKEYAI